MRFFTSSLCAVVVVALLAGCANNSSGQDGSVPGMLVQTRIARDNRAPFSLVSAWMLPSGVQRLHLATGLTDAKKAIGGIYGSEFCTDNCELAGLINGYPNPDKKNVKPTCTITGNAISGWGIDLQGDLILPWAKSGNEPSINEPSINVYAGPKLCGKEIGSIPDSKGQIVDAKSFDATTDPIYVSEIAGEGSANAGDVLICSLTTESCGSPVTNSAITGYGAGVAIDTKGDCWMSAATSTTSGFVLVYWKGCKGGGAVATGTKNAAFGGLFFDAKSNLVSIDSTGELYVYSGCRPKCKVVSSSALKGASIFGNLNQKGDRLAVGDVANTDVDVYSYAPTGIKYLYSFNNGLESTGYTEAAGFDPTNKAL